MKHRKDITMTESFGDLFIELLESIRKGEMTETKKYESENCVEVLDRDITFGIRDRICNENPFCGKCLLFEDGRCIGNHSPKGIKVKIPTRIIDAEAEYKKGLNE